MHMNFYGPLVPAVLIFVLILALEEWAYFKATTKLQRAAIAGTAVFLLLLVLGVFWSSPSH